MPSGRGRLTLRPSYSIPGRYQFEPARQAGVWEGSFTGDISRIDRGGMSGEVELICVGGLALNISVTIYSPTWLTFTALREESVGVVLPLSVMN